MIEEQAKKTIHFIFDLDNTLYSADIGFFKLIDRNINLYMRDKLHIDEKEIESKRIDYFCKYGTTLKGLQLFYEIDPDDYLKYVHDVDLESYLMPDGNLKAMLNELNFPKIICSNGNFEYVERVLKILGIHECFEDIIDIKRLEYIPKPYLEAYEIILDIVQANASQCVFIDDMRRNIRAAAKLGFRTVWLKNIIVQDKAVLFADSASIEDGRLKSVFDADDNFRPDYIINKIYELKSIIPGLVKEDGASY